MDPMGKNTDKVFPRCSEVLDSLDDIGGFVGVKVCPTIRLMVQKSGKNQLIW